MADNHFRSEEDGDQWPWPDEEADWQLMQQLVRRLFGIVSLRRGSPRILDNFGFTIKLDPDLPPDTILLQNQNGTKGMIYNINWEADDGSGPDAQ